MAARKEWQDFAELAPRVNESLITLSKAIHDSAVDAALLELVKLRASLINGCAFCIKYHTSNALKLGVSQDRLSLLAAWTDAPIYSEGERAALRWTDLLTHLDSSADVSDHEFAAVQEYFSDEDLAYLTAAIALINAWNRIARAYRFTPPNCEGSSIKATSGGRT